MLKFLTSFSFALAGLSYALRNESNFRVQWLSASAIFMLISLLSFSYFEQIILLILVAGVLSLELINSALEQLANANGTEYKLNIKHAKDLAASSVLIFSLGALLVFVLVVNNNLEILSIKIYNFPEFYTCLVIIIGLNFFMCIKNPNLILSIFLVSISVISHAILLISAQANGLFLGLSIFFHGLLLISHLRRAYS